jgi:hypothetical protein
MMEITEGFTSISAGSDNIEGSARRSPTGARIVVEFRSDESLAAGQPVTVRYDFAGDGALREGMGIARPTRTVVRWGRAVQYHYRVSYWIAPSALMSCVADKARSRVSSPLPGFPMGSRAIGPSPA